MDRHMDGQTDGKPTPYVSPPSGDETKKTSNHAYICENIPLVMTECVKRHTPASTEFVKYVPCGQPYDLGTVLLLFIWAT